MFVALGHLIEVSCVRLGKNKPYNSFRGLHLLAGRRNWNSFRTCAVSLSFDSTFIYSLKAIARWPSGTELSKSTLEELLIQASSVCKACDSQHASLLKSST